MKIAWSEPGTILSAALHGALLTMILVSFSNTQKFDDAQESIPIDTITDTQFNEIMKGEKTAKAVSPTPLPKVDRLANVEITKPAPPTPDAKIDVPTPPPPLKRLADPGEDEEPKELATPTPPVAALPPPRPADPTPIKPVVETPPPPLPPTRPPEAKLEPKPPVPDAEVIEQAAKPVPKKQVQTPPPLPPEKPRPAPKKEAVKPKPKPDTVKTDKATLDQISKLLRDKKTPVAEATVTETEKPPKPAKKPPSKPRSGDESQRPARSYNSNAIAQLLSREDPQSTGSTGRQLNREASLGSPTASAAHMSPSLWGALDGLIIDQYKQCWSYFGLATNNDYLPEIHVVYNVDGSLSGEPYLVKRPADPAMQGLADSALRAVKECNPLKIPAQFAPYFSQWRVRTLHFDPKEMSG